jgi:DNA polymerase
VRVCLPAPDDSEAGAARRALVLAGIEPDAVAEEPGRAPRPVCAGRHAQPPPRPGAAPVRASKPFLDLVRMALLNRAPERFDLAYRLLWRLQSQPRAAQDAADPLVRRLDQLPARCGAFSKMRAL